MDDIQKQKICEKIEDILQIANANDFIVIIKEKGNKKASVIISPDMESGAMSRAAIMMIDFFTDHANLKGMEEFLIKKPKS